MDYLLFIFQNEEFYICIYSERHGDTILFHHEGGVDIGDVDAKVDYSAVLYESKLNVN